MGFPIVWPRIICCVFFIRNWKFGRMFLFFVCLFVCFFAKQIILDFVLSCIVIEAFNPSIHVEIFSWRNLEVSSEFAICHFVLHGNVNFIQNPSTVANSTMAPCYILLPLTLPCRTTWQIANLLMNLVSYVSQQSGSPSWGALGIFHNNLFIRTPTGSYGIWYYTVEYVILLRYYTYA